MEIAKNGEDEQLSGNTTMRQLKLTIAALLMFSPFAANADVINTADVSGLTTFQDTNTGRIWLDMDNFFDASANVGTSGFDMIAAATAAGFQFATLGDVEELLFSLPLTGGQWATYAAVMGHGIPRQLIWGMYDDGNGNPFGYAWAYSNMTNWAFAANITDANIVQNGGIAGAVDMGIWAYKVRAVPEPGTLALLGLGLFGMGLARRNKKA